MGKRSREKKEKKELIEKRVIPKSVIIFENSGLFLFFSKIIQWGTYLILFTPLILSGRFFFPFVGPKSLYFMGLVEIIFFSWLFLIFHLPHYRPSKNPLLIALILFLIILILSSFFGANLSYSFWSKYERMTGLLMMFHLFAFFLVISSVFKKSDWEKIFSTSLFVATIVSFIAVFSKNPQMHGGGTIGNDSFLGTYLLFNLFLAIYLFFTGKKEIKIYSEICFFIIAIILFLTDARAAKFSFLGGLVLLFFIYLSFASQKRYLNFLGRFLLGFSFIVFFVCGFLLLFQPESLVYQKFIELATKARLVVWEKAWKGFLERPWLGWGPENFEFVFTKYFNPCMFLDECGTLIWFDRAHNIIFDTLVTTGILGVISYLGIFLSVFYLLWKNYFLKKVNFWVTGVFTVLLVVYFVQNLTVFDMVSSYMMFFLVLGFISSIFVEKKQIDFSKIKFPFHYYGLIILLIIFSFIFNKFVISPLKADAYVIDAVQSQDIDKKLSLFEKTLKTSSVGKYQIIDFFAQSVIEIINGEQGKKLPVSSIKKMLDFISIELEKSVKESPLDFRLTLKLGQIYNVYGILDKSKIKNAEDVLIKAIQLSPTNQQGYWALAQTKLYQNQPAEAVSLAEKAIELEKRVKESHLVLLQITKIIGDNELFERKFKEAIEINPEWEKEFKEILEKQFRNE